MFGKPALLWSLWSLCSLRIGFGVTPERMVGTKVQSTTTVGSEKRIANIVQRRLSELNNERMLAQDSKSTINH